ncbi:uncharacterized protein LOC136032806 isoform X2 [Artemia franciscana]|uniref:Protein FAM107B n=1 Tax=Artemia franciscana TaxID=6661 RepID=A0AA88I8W5_ARTSF|nr:hypothetical protein QYM36_001281 [Artemia franciscana]
MVVYGSEDKLNFQINMEENTKRPQFDENGLILPRRAMLPNFDTRRDLHRELMFNCKTGKSLLSEKSELSRALEKHKVNQTRKMVEEEKISSRSEIERALEERAKKLEELEKSNERNCEATTVCNPEFVRLHAKMKNRIQASN